MPFLRRCGRDSKHDTSSCANVRYRPKSADVGRAEQYLLCPVISDVDLFRYCEGIIYLDPEVPDGAFDLGVAEQELHSS